VNDPALLLPKYSRDLVPSSGTAVMESKTEGLMADAWVPGIALVAWSSVDLLFKVSAGD
jgi:hypothetical protein